MHASPVPVISGHLTKKKNTFNPLNNLQTPNKSNLLAFITKLTLKIGWQLRLPFGAHNLFCIHASHQQEGGEEEDLGEDHVHVLEDVKKNCNNNSLLGF